MGETTRSSNLQNLYQLTNLPGQRPEDQYLQALAAQQQSTGIQPYPAQGGQLTGPSEAGVGDLQGRYNGAANIGMNASTGLGSLAGGIASLILAPQVKKASQGAEANRIRAQGVELQAKELQNQQTQQQLAQNQKVLDYAKGTSALGLVQSGTDLTPDTVKLAGATFNPDGSIQTNAQKFNDLKTKGQIKYDLNQLIPYAPGLIGELSKVNSTLTQDQFFKALDDAAKEKSKIDNEILKTRAATYRDPYEPYKILSNLYEGLGKVSANYLDPNLSILAGPQTTALMGATIIPIIQTANQLGVKTGIMNKENQIAPADAMRALEDAKEGNTVALEKLFTEIQGVSQKATMMMNKPEGSPDNVKSKKPPLTVDSSTTIPVKKSESTSNLQTLGVE